MTQDIKSDLYSCAQIHTIHTKI